MLKEENQLEQNKREEPLSLIARAMITGFTGGVIASIAGFVMNYFNFTEISPKSFVLKSWVRASWVDGWLGTAISILIIGLLSLLIALIYYIALRKLYTMWMGVVFGIILWGLIFFVLQPLFPNIPAFVDLEVNTLVSTACLFILYGTFIGYSIAYDYHDTKEKEQKEKEQG
nr:YqhR family membrane protein [Virgibacillus sp. YIM 98842]